MYRSLASKSKEGGRRSSAEAQQTDRYVDGAERSRTERRRRSRIRLCGDGMTRSEVERTYYEDSLSLIHI